jgi:hypothetical protein
MDDQLSRILTDLIGRLTGPLTLRLYLQPGMAALFALRDGLKDAKAGRPPFLRTVFSSSARRPALIRDGWKSIGRVFVLAIVLDLIYQLRVFRWLYPLETLDVALILAVLPYALLRGPVNRLARMWPHHDPAAPAESPRSRP